MLEVIVLDKKHRVPVADCWLRTFQQLALDDAGYFFHAGFYCWNDRCKKCVFRYISGETGEARTRQGCQVKPRDGDRVIALPVDMAQL